MATPANGVAATYTPTTPGRVFFNSVLPEGFEFINEPVDKRLMGTIVDTLARKFEKQAVSLSLDGLKDMCFKYAMRSGVTVSIDDVRTPENKSGDSRRIRSRSRQGRAALPPRHHHRW